MKPAFDPAFILIVVLLVAIVITATRGRHGPRQIRLMAGCNQLQIQARALAMHQRREAFVLANPGQPVPALPMVSVRSKTISDRTDTLAFVAVIFGVFVGYFVSMFGHITFGQIKRARVRQTEINLSCSSAVCVLSSVLS